jgi:hypothetical protein
LGVAIADELQEFEVCPSFRDSSSSSPSSPSSPSKPCQFWGDVSSGLESSISLSTFTSQVEVTAARRGSVVYLFFFQRKKLNSFFSPQFLNDDLWARFFTLKYHTFGSFTPTPWLVSIEWHDVSSLPVLFRFITQPLKTPQIRVIPSVKLS